MNVDMSPNNNANLNKKIIGISLLTSSLIILIFIFYILGGLSFTRRLIDTYSCRNRESYYCAKLTQGYRENIYTDDEVPNEYGKRSSTYSFTTNAVLASINQKRLLVWSPDSFVKSFKINNATLFKVMVVYSDHDKNGENNLKEYVQKESLKDIPIPTSQEVQPDTNMRYIISTSKLTYSEFSEMLKSGNLLKITYDKNTNTATNVILINASRI